MRFYRRSNRCDQLFLSKVYRFHTVVAQDNSTAAWYLDPCTGIIVERFRDKAIAFAGSHWCCKKRGRFLVSRVTHGKQTLNAETLPCNAPEVPDAADGRRSI